MSRCGLPRWLKSTRIALASVARPTVEWSWPRCALVDDDGRRQTVQDVDRPPHRRHEVLDERAVGLVDEALGTPRRWCRTPAMTCPSPTRR